MHASPLAKWKERVRPKTWLLLNVLFYFRFEWFHYPDIIRWGSAYFRFQLERFHTQRTSVRHCIPIRTLSYFWRASTPSWVNEIHLQAGSYPIQSACYMVYLMFNYTTHLISHSVHAASLLYAWTDATSIYHLCCTPSDCQQDCMERLPPWWNWAQRPAEVKHQSLHHTEGCLVRRWNTL